MLKPGRFDKDNRCENGYIYTGKSVVAEQPGEDLCVLNNLYDPRRVTPICLDGEVCWDGIDHEPTDYLLDGIYKAQHSMYSKNDTSQTPYHMAYRWFPGRKHNVTFTISAIIAWTNAQLQYSRFTGYNGYSLIQWEEWFNCGSTVSCAAGDLVEVKSGELEFDDQYPPITRFRVKVGEDESDWVYYQIPVKIESKYHTGYYFNWETDRGGRPNHYSLAQQNYYSSVIPVGMSATNMPIHLATRIRTGGAPEYFNNYPTYLNYAPAGTLNLFNPLLSTEWGSHGCVVDPANCWQVELNQPKETYNVTPKMNADTDTEYPTYAIEARGWMAPYTKLYLNGLGFRNYTGLTSPGQRLWTPKTSSVGSQTLLAWIQEAYGGPQVPVDPGQEFILRAFYATSKRITFWINLQGLDGSYDATPQFKLWKCIDKSQKVARLYGQMRNDEQTFGNPLSDMYSKLTLINSTSITTRSTWIKYTIDIDSDDEELYYISFYQDWRIQYEYGQGGYGGGCLFYCHLNVTPPTPPLFDVFQIKGAVDPDKLLLEDGMRFTTSDEAPITHDTDGSMYVKPEIIYTDNAEEVTIPFTPMGSNGSNITTYTVCFRNPQIPEVSGSEYFYINSDITSYGGTYPRTLYDTGVNAWEAGNIGRSDYGGWMQRNSFEFGRFNYGGYNYSNATYYTNQIGLLQNYFQITPTYGGTINWYDTYIKNGTPVYVTFSVSTGLKYIDTQTYPAIIVETSPPTSIKIKLNKKAMIMYTTPADGSLQAAAPLYSFTAPTSGNFKLEAHGGRNEYRIGTNLHNLNDTIATLKIDKSNIISNGYSRDLVFLHSKAEWNLFDPTNRNYDFYLKDSFEDGLPESIYKNKLIRYNKGKATFDVLNLHGIFNEKTVVNILGSGGLTYSESISGAKLVSDKINVTIPLEAGQKIYVSQNKPMTTAQIWYRMTWT